MKKEEIKVGDRVLVKTSGFFADVFHAHVKAIGIGILGRWYLCEWVVNDLGYGLRYTKVDFLRWWNVICKD